MGIFRSFFNLFGKQSAVLTFMVIVSDAAYSAASRFAYLA